MNGGLSRISHRSALPLFVRGAALLWPAHLLLAGLSVQDLKTDLAQADATTWKPEVLARHYEQTIVQLADEIRRADDKIAVLARLPFEELALPRPQREPERLDPGIALRSFSSQQPLHLPHPAWQRALQQMHQDGWRLRQTEWHHENFRPPTPDQPAWSQFSFQLHGDQPAQTNRFILDGTLEITWATPIHTSPDARPQPERIVVTHLQLLEQNGPPAFNNHLLVTPEPDQPGAPVNVHPLIVQDLNADQHEDILLPGVNKVLLNDGQARFRLAPFLPADRFAGLKETGVVADFNRDGHLDYLGFPASGPWSNQLVLHPGNSTLPFTAPAQPAWPDHTLEAPSCLTAGDVDGDGDLDVWLGQYRPPYTGGQLPTPYYDALDGYSSHLLLNDGRGRFAQATGRAGLHAKRFRRTLAASLADLDLDGDLDLLTLNDFSGVDLYYNQGNGTFSDETARLDNRHLFGMSHCLADFNHDTLPDIFAIGMSLTTVRRLEAMGLQPDLFPDRSRKRVDMAYGHRLYLHQQGQWIQPDFARPLARTGWSWGASAFDLDNDGDLELYIANGHVSGASAADYCSRYWTRDIYLGTSREDPQLQLYFAEALSGLNTGQTSWNGYLHNALFLDTGQHRYLQSAFLMGVAHETDCRAVVSADFNSDGRPDLVLTEALWMGSPHLMRHRLLVHLNQLPSPHHWIGFKLAAPAGCASPLGATVRVQTPARTFVGLVTTGDSFQSQHPCTVHFGLGQTERVDFVQIQWPHGPLQVIPRPAVDQYHVVASPASSDRPGQVR